jgi:hypothetical protein
LHKQGKIRIETLESSGRWFRERYPLTPATALTALTDHRNHGNKTVWYNSRFYRVNLLWEGSAFRFRDIHLFDERFESDYLTKAGESTQCIYTTLPVVDGFMWSTPNEKAGLRIVGNDGKPLTVGAPTVSELPDIVLQVTFSDATERKFTLTFYEDRVEVTGNDQDAWTLELKTAETATLPFLSIEKSQIRAAHNGFEYSIACRKGSFAKADGCVFRILPDKGKITVDCKSK